MSYPKPEFTSGIINLAHVPEEFLPNLRFEDQGSGPHTKVARFHALLWRTIYRWRRSTPEELRAAAYEDIAGWWQIISHFGGQVQAAWHMAAMHRYYSVVNWGGQEKDYCEAIREFLPEVVHMAKTLDKAFAAAPTGPVEGDVMDGLGETRENWQRLGELARQAGFREAPPDLRDLTARKQWLTEIIEGWEYRSRNKTANEKLAFARLANEMLEEIIRHQKKRGELQRITESEQIEQLQLKKTKAELTLAIAKLEKEARDLEDEPMKQAPKKPLTPEEKITAALDGIREVAILNQRERDLLNEFAADPVMQNEVRLRAEDLRLKIRQGQKL